MNRSLFVFLLTGALAAQGALFRTTRSISIPPRNGSYDITAGDVDGDGAIDLLCANDHAPMQLFRNTGRGSFIDVSATWLPTIASFQATTMVTLVDIDRDGDLDILATNDDNVANYVFRNDGTGHFTDDPAALPPNAFFSVGSVVGDFDGDGSPDWLTLDFGQMHLYLNNGAGKFRDATATHLPSGGVTVWGYRGNALDLDGDGDLDVVLDDRVLLNQGQGHFAIAPTSYFPAGPMLGRHAVGDVDGDGRTDVLLRAIGKRVLLRNLGGGAFADVTAASGLLPLAAVDEVLLIDVDLDGDLDLVAPGVLWIQDRPLHFTNRSGLAGTIDAARDLRAADLDGDGDLDVFSNFTPVHVNHLRQVDAPRALTLGGTYTVDFWVRPGLATADALLLPALAFAEARLPAGDLGIFRLDPATTLTLPLEVVRASIGRVQRAYAIPNDPRLVGLQLHHQALLLEWAAAPRLTNAISDIVR